MGLESPAVGLERCVGRATGIHLARRPIARERALNPHTNADSLSG